MTNKLIQRSRRRTKWWPFYVRKAVRNEYVERSLTPAVVLYGCRWWGTGVRDVPSKGDWRPWTRLAVRWLGIEAGIEW